MITSPATYTHYFRQLSHRIHDLEGFISGNSERILSEERPGLNYPLLWLETPSISFKGTDCYFQGGMVILINAELDKPAEQDWIINRTFEIAQKIINQIEEDGEDLGFDVKGDIHLDPIHTATHDNDYGWRINLTLKVPMGNCVSSSDLDSQYQLDTIAAFNWENKSEGSIDLAILDKSNVSSGYTSKFDYQIDGGDWVLDQDISTPIISPGTYIWLRLAYTDGARTYWAGAQIFNHISRGHSVPFKVK